MPSKRKHMSRKRRIILSDSDEEQDEPKRQHPLPPPLCSLLGSNSESDSESPGLVRDLDDWVVPDSMSEYDTEYELGSSSSASSEMSSGEDEGELEVLSLPEPRQQGIVRGGPCVVCGAHVPEEEWIKHPLRRWGFTLKNAQKCDLVCPTCSPQFTLSVDHGCFVLSKGGKKRCRKCTAPHRVIPHADMDLFNSISDQTISLGDLERLATHPGTQEYEDLQEGLVANSKAVKRAFRMYQGEITLDHLFATCLYGNATPSRGLYCLLCCNEQDKNKASDFKVGKCTSCDIKTDAFCHPASLCNRCFRSRYCWDEDDQDAYV